MSYMWHLLPWQKMLRHMRCLTRMHEHLLHVKNPTSLTSFCVWPLPCSTYRTDLDVMRVHNPCPKDPWPMESSLIKLTVVLRCYAVLCDSLTSLPLAWRVPTYPSCQWQAQLHHETSHSIVVCRANSQAEFMLIVMNGIYPLYPPEDYPESSFLFKADFPRCSCLINHSMVMIPYWGSPSLD